MHIHPACVLRHVWRAVGRVRAVAMGISSAQVFNFELSFLFSTLVRAEFQVQVRQRALSRLPVVCCSLFSCGIGLR